MGGGWSSPRKVTFERENENGILQVQESDNIQPLSNFTDEKPKSPEVGDDFDLRQAQCIERILELEKQNSHFYESSVKELARAVKAVEEKYLKSSSTPICAEPREAAMLCYSANSKLSLNCSSEVRAFSNCVQSYRQQTGKQHKEA